jgi:hypothetical protein
MTVLRKTTLGNDTLDCGMRAYKMTLLFTDVTHIEDADIDTDPSADTE